MPIGGAGSRATSAGHHTAYSGTKVLSVLSSRSRTSVRQLCDCLVVAERHKLLRRARRPVASSSEVAKRRTTDRLPFCSVPLLFMRQLKISILQKKTSERFCVSNAGSLMTALRLTETVTPNLPGFRANYLEPHFMKESRRTVSTLGYKTLDAARGNNTGTGLPREDTLPGKTLGRMDQLAHFVVRFHQRNSTKAAAYQTAERGHEAIKPETCLR